MTNYVKTTNFTAKDSLPTSDPGKLVKGYDFDVEFSAVATAVASKADSYNAAFTGIPTAPTAAAATNTTQLATTAFVGTTVANERTATTTLTNKTINLSNNTLTATSAQIQAAVTDETGSGSLVFNTSPSFSGTPTAPTASSGTSTTQIATTAFVQNQKVSPAFTGIPTAPTASSGTNTTQLATTSFVGTAVTNERTASATLTNKTLSAPTINSPSLIGGAISGTSLSSVSISSGSISNITDLAVADGGTGSSTASGSRTKFGVPSTTGSGASGTWAISITGNAATATSAGSVTNGVYTTGTQTIGGSKTFSSPVVVDTNIQITRGANDDTVSVGVGNGALDYFGLTGTGNTAFGAFTLANCYTGDGNTGVGYNSMSGNQVTGDYNTAIGDNAGHSVSSGGYNVFIGRYAGYSLTGGSSNIYIGAYAAPLNSTSSMEVVINGTGGTKYGKGTGTGYLVTGTGGSGSWYQGNNSSSWATTSDQRIKENFVDVTDGLSIINALNPVEFDYITTKQHDVGFKAQEYMEVLPDQVSKHAANEEEQALAGEDEIYGIQRNLDPYLVSAIKELTKRLEEAEAKLEALSNG